MTTHQRTRRHILRTGNQIIDDVEFSAAVADNRWSVWQFTRIVLNEGANWRDQLANALYSFVMCVL